MSAVLAPEVIDHQRRFLEAFTEPDAHRYLTYLIQNIESEVRPDLYRDIVGDVPITEHARSAAEEYLRMTGPAVRAAYAFWASEDMMQLVRVAGDQLPGTAYLTHEDLPAECGFAMFEKPFVVNELPVAGLMWHPFSTTRLAGPKLDNMDRQGRRVPGIQLTVLASNPDVWKLVAPPGEVEVGNWMAAVWGHCAPIDFMFIPYETRIGPAPIEQSPHRTFLSFCLMLNAAITEVTSEAAPRQFARRAKRVGLPQRVNVIKLRRINRNEHAIGESKVEWSHRWFVRGHWHTYYYGPGRSLTKRIWLSPYIKGPEHLPLAVTEKVYALVR